MNTIVLDQIGDLIQYYKQELVLTLTECSMFYGAKVTELGEEKLQNTTWSFMLSMQPSGIQIILFGFKNKSTH